MNPITKLANSAMINDPLRLGTMKKRTLIALCAVATVAVGVAAVKFGTEEDTEE